MSTKVFTVPTKNLFVPWNFGKLSVEYNGHEFCVVDSKNNRFPVANRDVISEIVGVSLKGISMEKLGKTLTATEGQFRLKKCGNDYTLHLHGGLKGGGFLLAALVYVGANVVGGAMIVAGAVTAPVGGAALVAGGAALVSAAPFTLVATLPAPTP